MRGTCTRCKEEKNIHTSGVCDSCRNDIRKAAMDGLRTERDSLFAILQIILNKTADSHHTWELDYAKAQALIHGIRQRSTYEDNKHLPR